MVCGSTFGFVKERESPGGKLLNAEYEKGK
jgi:hypothetical protein